LNWEHGKEIGRVIGKEIGKATGKEIDYWLETGMAQRTVLEFANHYPPLQLSKSSQTRSLEGFRLVGGLASIICPPRIHRYPEIIWKPRELPETNPRK
jgi:hypothetical protein